MFSLLGFACLLVISAAGKTSGHIFCNTFVSYIKLLNYCASKNLCKCRTFFVNLGLFLEIFQNTNHLCYHQLIYQAYQLWSHSVYYIKRLLFSSQFF